MQYCKMFGLLVLGYTVCFKVTGPRKQAAALVSTETSAFSHFLGVDFSETYLMTSAEKSVS